MRSMFRSAAKIRRTVLIALSVSVPLIQLLFRGFPFVIVEQHDGSITMESVAALSSLKSGTAAAMVVVTAKSNKTTAIAMSSTASGQAATTAAVGQETTKTALRPPPPKSAQGRPGGDDTTTSIKTTTSTTSTVRWLDSKAIKDTKDFFSASWLMSMNTFVKTKVSDVGNVEGGCFSVFGQHRNQMRMSLDWLDFSVEHMSKWWKVMGCPKNPVALNLTATTFRSYIDATQNGPRHQLFPDPTTTSPLHPTLALIAFQPFRGFKTNRTELELPDHELTTTSLAATVTSLLQVGMGRIVVVGYKDVDESVVHDAYRIVDPSSCNDNNKNRNHNQKGYMCSVRGGTELAFVRATDDLVKTSIIKVNMPQAALAGLMRAKGHEVRGAVGDDMWQRAWLGTRPDYWQYVYLTEPDTLLHTRPGTLEHIRNELDAGHVLAPHRFQPIPHEADAAVTGHPKLVPNDYKAPIVIRTLNGDGEDDDADKEQAQVEVPHACCDAQEGSYKPWKDPKYADGCPSFWWTCGFWGKGSHSRLEHYELMRLSDGTGIVTLAGNEHGRRCIPKYDDGPCEYKTATEVTSKS